MVPSGRMRRMLLAIIWLAVAPPVYGWGLVGHALVARLAAARLTPRATAAVADILGPDVTMASHLELGGPGWRERAAKPVPGIT